MVGKSWRWWSAVGRPTRRAATFYRPTPRRPDEMRRVARSYGDLRQLEEYEPSMRVSPGLQSAVMTRRVRRARPTAEMVVRAIAEQDGQ